MAFKDCGKLENVSIGVGIEHIDDKAFCNCKMLLNLYCHSEKMPQTGADIFEGSYLDYTTLYVKKNIYEGYKNTKPWSNFGKIEVLSDK